MSTNIVVPELGESVVEARVAKWLKKPGDAVAAGDALVELETEKIDLEVSADRAGVLRDIKHQEGADVKVGEVLAVLEEATSNGSEPTRTRCLGCQRCQRCQRARCQRCQVPVLLRRRERPHPPRKTSRRLTT